MFELLIHVQACLSISQLFQIISYNSAILEKSSFFDSPINLSIDINQHIINNTLSFLTQNYQIKSRVPSTCIYIRWPSRQGIRVLQSRFHHPSRVTNFLETDCSFSGVRNSHCARDSAGVRESCTMIHWQSASHAAPRQQFNGMSLAIAIPKL